MNQEIKKRTNSQRKGITLFLMVALMLSIFCVLKVLRGSDTGSSAQGGIWNYISLLFYPVFLFAFLIKKRYKVSLFLYSSILYMLFALIPAIGKFSAEGDITYIYQFIMIPYPILVFLTFYFCSDESDRGKKIILLGYFACLALNLYSVITFQFAEAEQAQQSDIYFSLGLFPFALLFLKRKDLRIVTVVLEFLAVFMVNKRTALISFLLALVAYLLIDSYMKEKSKFFSMLKTLTIIALIALVFYGISKYLDDKYEMGVYSRLFRLSEDGGSGRDIIYRNIWNGFHESSLAEKLFGHGMKTAGKIGGASQAHNDFLEILYDYGLLDFIFAVLFYVSLIVEQIRLIRKKSPYASCFAVSLVIGLFLAMFSYFLIFYTYVTCIMAFWGYVLAMEEKRLKRLQKEGT